MTLSDYKEYIAKADAGTIPDNQNPAFILSYTNSKLLADIISGKIDMVKLAKIELAMRGVDTNGKWVGYDIAKKQIS